MEPRDLIKKLGGAATVGSMCGIKYGAVLSWSMCGYIPYKHHTKILDACEKAGMTVARETLEKQCETA